VPRKNPSSEPTYAAAKPTVDQLLTNSRNLNRASTDFLKVDVETALTFASFALHTDDSVKKGRNKRAARRAYDSVLRLSKKVELTEVDARELSVKLKQLKSELEALGEVF
jgi:hypothetical protein